MLTVALLLLAQVGPPPDQAKGAVGTRWWRVEKEPSKVIVSITPDTPEVPQGTKVRIVVGDPTRVEIVGDPKLDLARVQLEFYRMQALKAANQQQLAQEEARLRAEYERLVRALPGYAPGCDADERQELKCPPRKDEK